jgi:hypothetical protein
VAGVLAAAVLAQTALPLAPPSVSTTDRTLSIARKDLVAANEQGDFEFPAAQPVWRGKPLRNWLEHVELAHYKVVVRCLRAREDARPPAGSVVTNCFDKPQKKFIICQSMYSAAY